MAAGSERDPDQPVAKRMKSVLSFSSVVREVRIVEIANKIAVTLEPSIRRVVRDEVERALEKYSKSLCRSTHLHIEEIESSPNIKLRFVNSPPKEVFTGSRLVDRCNNPLQITLSNNETGDSSTVYLGSPIEVEIVVLDGDWNSDDFNSKILKPRDGKRPLLVGKSRTLTLGTTSASVEDIMFTDNSSWVRSGRFKLGVRVRGGPIIKEAVTDSFIVKDQRGESYMKHYPPSPSDDVWRLTNISKGGKIHSRLMQEGIQTVADFLKLSISNRYHLQKLLHMPEKAFEKTLEHASTCTKGEEYGNWHEQEQVILNPIGETSAAGYQIANVEQGPPLAHQQGNNSVIFHDLPLEGQNYYLQEVPAEGLHLETNHYGEDTSSWHQNGWHALFGVNGSGMSMSPFLEEGLDGI